MKNSRNIKTVDLIEALRRCSTPGVHCDGCVFCSDEDHEEPWCGDVLLQEAVRRLEEYTDRCARYAEEIAVLKTAGERVEWIPVTESLPEEGGLYITFGCAAVPVRWLHNFDKDIGKFGSWWNYEPDGKEHPRYRFIEAGNISHWAPLPTPPKGE